MERARYLAVSLLVTLGLLSALGWSGASLAAAPFGPSAANQAHGDGCREMAPAHHRGPMSFTDELCATCCAVLPPLAQVPHQAPAPVALVQTMLQPLSGIDPGLDPPPPRAG